MVEKVGHKKQVMTARNEWISQSQKKNSGEEENEDDDLFGDDADVLPSTESVQRQGTSELDPPRERPRTPQNDDVPDDDDLYDVTPRTSRPATKPPTSTSHDIPDDDELDALMAEYGAPSESVQPSQSQQPKPAERGGNDEDDLDALVAEAELFDQAKQKELPLRSDQAGQSTGPSTTGQEQELEGLWD